MGLLWKFDRFFLPLRKKNKKKNPVPSGHNTNMCNWDRETESKGNLVSGQSFQRVRLYAEVGFLVCPGAV